MEIYMGVSGQRQDPAPLHRGIKHGRYLEEAAAWTSPERVWAVWRAR